MLLATCEMRRANSLAEVAALPLAALRDSHKAMTRARVSVAQPITICASRSSIRGLQPGNTRHGQLVHPGCTQRARRIQTWAAFACAVGTCHLMCDAQTETASGSVAKAAAQAVQACCESCVRAGRLRAGQQPVCARCSASRLRRPVPLSCVPWHAVTWCASSAQARLKAHERAWVCLARARSPGKPRERQPRAPMRRCTLLHEGLRKPSMLDETDRVRTA